MPSVLFPARSRAWRAGIVLLVITSLCLLVGGLYQLSSAVARWLAPEVPVVLEHHGLTPVDIPAAVEIWRSGKSRILAADGAEMGALELERCAPVDASTLPFYVLGAFEAVGQEVICQEGGELGPLLAAVDHHPGLLSGDLSGTEPLLEQHCAQLKEALFSWPQHRTPLGFAVGGGQWLPLHDRQALLGAWINLMSFGDGIFGIEAASQAWFAHPAAALTPAESALLAARALHPEARRSSTTLRRARDQVLEALLSRGLLSPATVAEAKAITPQEAPKVRNPVPRLPEYVRRAVLETLDRLPGNPEVRHGVEIHTAFEPGLQQVAAKSIERVIQTWRSNRKKEAAKMSALLESFEPVEGGPTEPEVPAGAWTSPPGTKDQPALTFMALEPRTGRVKVLYESCSECSAVSHGAFHRKRQPGSSWKPFVYATALEQGMNQVVSFPDKPFTYQVKQESWSPKNHEEKYYGQTIARRALAQSLNSVAIQLIFRVTPEKVVKMAHRLGVHSRLKAVPALALGTSPVTLAELVESYAVFASSGYRTHARFVDRIASKAGNVLYGAKLEKDEPVLDPRVAYVMADMMREVTAHGTAWPARKLKFPVAGKTGTTNESKDAWFVGFSSNLVAGVWVGFDQKDAKPLGGHETGGSLALPVWIDVMANAAKKEVPGDFPLPPGVNIEVRSPWGGHRHPEGREMAFIGTDSKPCYEIAPPFAAPKDESEANKQSRLTRLSRWRSYGNSGYRCPWTPISARDGSAELTLQGDSSPRATSGSSDLPGG